MDILFELNYRYSQASTYYHLGKVAEATEEIGNAKNYYLQDLEISVEFNDQHSLDIIYKNLARFYRNHPDKTFLQDIAHIAHQSPKDIQQRFDTLNEANEEE